MLEVIQFDNMKYGIQNTWTGQPLRNADGSLREFRSKGQAIRVLNRMSRRLERTVRRVTKH
jgi:hypothetical protein